MITIEGLCEQLRRFNESSNGKDYRLLLNDDTSCCLFSTKDPAKSNIHRFGNPYQLMEYFTAHTGVRR